MKEIILIFIFSALTFIAFLVILIIGLIKKRRKLVLISIFPFVVAVILGIFGVALTTRKTINKISKFSKPRSGTEIYESLLGKPETNCIQILNFQDQSVPQIDYAIWLHFKTCPNELKRILNNKQFECEKISTKNINSDQPNANENWFKPENMGDSILTFKFYDERGNGQEIYSSKDSTEVYLKDIAD